MAEEPVVPVMISQLVSKFKELVKKVTYDKSEIDSKLNGKASNNLVSSSANGLMSSVDKTKLDGIDEEANKIVVDSAMSSSSVNPVQNKIVYQELGNKSDVGHVHSMSNITGLESELDSLNSAKANISHTHNSLTPILIPEGSDLNDYITQGSYYCQPNVVSATIANTPYEKSFHLEVYRHAGVRQVFMSYHPTVVETWERNYYDGQWSAWKQVQFIE